ncbi:MAG: hypothetical protein V4448_13115 [Pseudomonadota bacterium]
MASITSPEQGAQQECSKTLPGLLGRGMGSRLKSVIVLSRCGGRMGKGYAGQRAFVYRVRMLPEVEKPERHALRALLL